MLRAECLEGKELFPRSLLRDERLWYLVFGLVLRAGSGFGLQGDKFNQPRKRNPKMQHIHHSIWSGGNPDNCLCACHHVFDLRAGYCFFGPSHPSKIMKCVFGYVLRTPTRNSDPSRGCIHPHLLSPLKVENP